VVEILELRVFDENVEDIDYDWQTKKERLSVFEGLAGM
jgi:hypothetical protein